MWRVNSSKRNGRYFYIICRVLFPTLASQITFLSGHKITKTFFLILLDTKKNHVRLRIQQLHKALTKEQKVSYINSSESVNFVSKMCRSIQLSRPSSPTQFRTLAFKRRRSTGSSTQSSDSESISPSSSPTGAALGGSSVTSCSMQLSVLSLVQRSNATLVKSNVVLIAQKCKELEAHCGCSPGASERQRWQPPLSEIRALHACSDDSYYQVVLAKCGAIPTILSAMITILNNTTASATTDDDDLEFLKICACTLHKLCQGNQQNYQSVLMTHGGGETTIRRAYERYPTSFELHQVTKYFS